MNFPNEKSFFRIILWFHTQTKQHHFDSNKAHTDILTHTGAHAKTQKLILASFACSAFVVFLLCFIVPCFHLFLYSTLTVKHSGLKKMLKWSWVKISPSFCCSCVSVQSSAVWRLISLNGHYKVYKSMQQFACDIKYFQDKCNIHESEMVQFSSSSSNAACICLRRWIVSKLGKLIQEQMQPENKSIDHFCHRKLFDYICETELENIQINTVETIFVKLTKGSFIKMFYAFKSLGTVYVHMWILTVPRVNSVSFQNSQW